MTLHINAKPGSIAEFVLMPGDPLRAKVMADKFLTNYHLVNTLRGMSMYTGYYKGMRVTIAASGMGNGSMGIYSYELFHDYQVKVIIRVGTAGAYRATLPLYSLFLAQESFAENDFAKIVTHTNTHCVSADASLNQAIEETARELNLKLESGRVHCSDVFYRFDNRLQFAHRHHLDVVEMESFALLSNAQALKKKAAILLTISDNLVTHQLTTPKERQDKMDQMFKLALETGYRYLKP